MAYGYIHMTDWVGSFGQECMCVWKEECLQI